MKYKTEKIGCAIGVVPVLIWLAVLIGEVMCVVKFFKSDFEPSYKREIIYGVSAITGIGCITGWMDFPDTKPTNHE